MSPTMGKPYNHRSTKACVAPHGNERQVCADYEVLVRSASYHADKPLVDRHERSCDLVDRGYLLAAEFREVAAVIDGEHHRRSQVGFCARGEAGMG